MMIWHIFTEHTLCKLHAVCQGGGSEQDKAPTLMLSQCWGASHVNGCMVGSDMSPWKDSDGVLWGAVGGREEDQPGGRRRPSSVWGGSTHPGPWKMERNYSRGVSRVRVYTVCALEEHSFVWEYVETLKLQRLTQGPAASQTSQGRKEQNTNGLILLASWDFWGERCNRDWIARKCFSSGWGAVTGRVWILPEEEQRESMSNVQRQECVLSEHIERRVCRP